MNSYSVTENISCFPNVLLFAALARYTVYKILSWACEGKFNVKSSLIRPQIDLVSYIDMGTSLTSFVSAFLDTSRELFILGKSCFRQNLF